MGKYTLSIRDISKCFGKKWALQSVSAELTEGVYGFLGPNGAGKTTLQNIIADLLKPSAGQVLWCGNEVHCLGSAYRSILGLLPQQIGFYPNFTAYEILAYFAALRSISDPDAKIYALLELVNLSDECDKMVGGFSGGMLRRLGIAVALLSDPKLLILDEPTAGLDPKERIRFRGIIEQLGQDRIVILTTHIVSDVDEIADQIMLLRQGELVAFGSAETLKSSLTGRIWTVSGSFAEMQELQRKYHVEKLRQNDRCYNAVVFSDTPPLPNSKAKKPDLEDVYMHYFSEETVCAD